MKVIILILLLSSFCYAQQPYCDTKCKISISTYSLGIGLDAHSSWGRLESTGIFRKEDKTFSPNKYFLYHSSIMGTTLLFQKKFPIQMFWVRIVGGVALTGFAIRNYKIR